MLRGEDELYASLGSAAVTVSAWIKLDEAYCKVNDKIIASQQYEFYGYGN